MKKKSLLSSILLIVGLGFYTMLNTSYSSGFTSYRTTCGSCHGSANAATTVSVNGLPTFYSPSTAYPFTVTVTNNTKVSAGFQVQANIGTISTTEAGIIVYGNNRSAGHNARRTLSSGTATFNMTWTSPAVAGTAANFTAVGNAVNNANGSGGDIWNNAPSTVVPLQVHFGEISAQQFDNHTLLSFVTEYEENIKIFKIERGTDGTNFTEISEVTPTGVGNYEYKDYTAEKNKIHYYRIKDISNDLVESYSAVVKTNSTTNSLNEISVHPTLISENGALQVNGLKSNSKAQFELFDFAGRKIFSSDIAGNTVQLTSLPIGNYFAVISQNNTVKKVQKITYQ
jgi:hypothetical protein